MASPPYAKLRIHVNGGAPQTGEVVCAGGDVITFTAENTADWKSARWELYDFPPGFSTPPGWSHDEVADVHFASGTLPPPAITLPAAATHWGKYMPQLVINNAVTDPTSDAFRAELVDTGSVIVVPSPILGLHGPAYRESTQVSKTRAWKKDLYEDLSKLETGGGGGGSGEINTASNLGSSGARLYSSKVGADLRFRRLIGGTNVTLTENTNDVTIAVSVPDETVAGGALNSVQYHGPGASFVGASDVAISSGQLALNTSIGALPTKGTVRIAGGGIDGDGFHLRMRGVDSTDGTTARDIGLGYGYTRTIGAGVVQNVVGLFGDWEGTVNECPDIVEGTFRQALSFAWATPTPESDYSGVHFDSWFSASPIAGYNHRRAFVLQRHTNFVMLGTRDHLASPEQAFGNGEGVAYIGWAEVNPSTNPTMGVTLWCSSADNLLRYRTPSGTIYTLNGEVNTTSNVGTGAGLALAKSGVNFPFKSLLAGSGISITPGTNDITIGCTVVPGETNTSSNVGTGAQLAMAKSGVNLPFRTLLGNGPVSVTQGTNEVTVGFTTPGSSGQLLYNNGGNPAATGGWSTNGTGLTGTSAAFVAFEAGGAPSGLVRLKSGARRDVVTTDNGAGGARSLLWFDSTSADVSLGHDSYKTSLDGSRVQLKNAGVTRLAVDADRINVGFPMVGDPDCNSPWGSDGDGNIVMASADKTLTDTEYSKKILRFTGTLGANRTVTLPLVPSGDGYTKEIILDINEPDNGITLRTGTGARVCYLQWAAIRRVTVAVTEDRVTVVGCVTAANVSQMSNA